MVDKKEKIDVDTEDKKVLFETSEDVEVYPTFDKMGLREELLRGKTKKISRWE